MEKVGKYLKIGVAVVLAFSLLAPFTLEVYANDPQTGTSTEHYEVRWDKPQLNDTNGYINVFSEDVNTGERFVETFYWNIAPQNDYYLPQIPSYMDITVGSETIRFNAKIGMDLNYEDNLNFKLTILRYHGRGLSVIKSSTCANEEHTSFIYNDGLDIGRKILGYYVYGNVGIVTDELGTNKDNNFTVTYGVTADSNPYNIYFQMLQMMEELEKDISNMELIISNNFDMAISTLSTNIVTGLLSVELRVKEILDVLKGNVNDIKDTTNQLNDSADNINSLNNQLQSNNSMDSVNSFIDSILSEDTFVSNSNFITTASFVGEFMNSVFYSNEDYLLLIYSSLAFGVCLMIVGKKV